MQILELNNFERQIVSDPGRRLSAEAGERAEFNKLTLSRPKEPRWRFNSGEFASENIVGRAGV
jgi:hypothetical protein